MHIDKTRFKSLAKWEKQCQSTNNFCLYCGKPGPIICECPKKCGPHVAHVISITNSQLEESDNEHVQSQ